MRFLLRTTLNCPSGDCPVLEEVEEGGVGVILSIGFSSPNPKFRGPEEFFALQTWSATSIDSSSSSNYNSRMSCASARWFYSLYGFFINPSAFFDLLQLVFSSDVYAGSRTKFGAIVVDGKRREKDLIAVKGRYTITMRETRRNAESCAYDIKRFIRRDRGFKPSISRISSR
jgi:hypothetical protein